MDTPGRSISPRSAYLYGHGESIATGGLSAGDDAVSERRRRYARP